MATAIAVIAFTAVALMALDLLAFHSGLRTEWALAAWTSCLFDDVANVRIYSELPHVPDQWPPTRTFLDKLADTDGRITVVGVNWGYMDMFELWQDRAERVGLRNYVIMAYDQESYSHLQSTGRVLFPLAGFRNETQSGAVKYGSDAFKSLTRNRPAILKAVLDLGYTVFYSDIDTAFRRNPYGVFERMVKAEPDLDVILSEDGCPGLWCSCLLYLRPRPATSQLVQHWLDVSRSATSGDDQDTLNLAKGRMLGWFWSGIRYGLVPSWVFPSGKIMFRDANYDWVRHPEGPAVVHANWMIGHDNKMHALMDTAGWHNNKP